MNYFKKTLSLFFLFQLPAIIAVSQPYFRQCDSIPVEINSSFIRNPWAGGLNFVQVSAIDLNLDGIKDLFVFDRTGYKIRTFINGGTADSVDYKYAPQYEALFPNLHDWALLVDYNCDNKEDIFSYADHGGGFKVYKNTSTLATGLQFTLIDTLMRSSYNPPDTITTYNLYVSSVDVPAFSDIDNDGDLDVITFVSSPATSLEYHQNQSVERGFGCDSLIYVMANRCFGFASEDMLSNVFTLHDSCSTNVINPEMPVENSGSRSADRHSGNCELCIDLDGDADKELIVGSVSFNNMNVLVNGGTPEHNNFVANNSQFPSAPFGNQPVAMDLFPCAYYVDVNNDGAKDLLVSPNATNASQDFNSLLYYKNIGTTAAPNFMFQQYNLLQDNMIEVGEGAYPVFFDYDNDGLQDLFIGNYGYYDTLSNFTHKISQYHNIGTAANPAFQLVTRDYDNLSSLHIINMEPAFGDMDGDGDKDMIIGDATGHLYYFQNIAGTVAPANFVLSIAPMVDAASHQIDVGDFAAPQIVDVDGDNKNDVLVGARNGKITYLHHTGSATATNPLLDTITSFFGHVNVRTPSYITGFAQPFLFKQGAISMLLVGEEAGYIHLYDSIDGNLSGTFNLVNARYQNIFQGSHTAPALADITNDGYKDLIVGNYQGGLSFYKGQALNSVSVPVADNSPKWNFLLFPNPANNSITIKINADKSSVYSVDIYTILGEQIVSEKTTSDSFVLPTSQLSSGMYFLKVSDKVSSMMKRLVVQH